MIEEFHWLIEGKLAGCARPGLLSDFDEDISWLVEAGFRRVYSLTRRPLEPVPESVGLKIEQFPIEDMGIPTPREVSALCDEILAAIASGEKVVVHCKAGLGRTGLVLACCLISIGHSGEMALKAVRRVCRGYVQSEVQERFLGHFADFLEGTDLARVPDIGATSFSAT